MINFLTDKENKSTTEFSQEVPNYLNESLLTKNFLQLNSTLSCNCECLAETLSFVDTNITNHLFYAEILTLFSQAVLETNESYHHLFPQ